MRTGADNSQAGVLLMNNKAQLKSRADSAEFRSPINPAMPTWRNKQEQQSNDRKRTRQDRL